MAALFITRATSSFGTAAVPTFPLRLPHNKVFVSKYRYLARYRYSTAHKAPSFGSSTSLGAFSFDPQTTWRRLFSGHVPGNKYASFRRRLFVQGNNSDDESSQVAKDLDPQRIARETFSVLARKGRTWRRLGHIVDCCCEDGGDDDDSKSVADLGCDHGLLAIALAASGRYEKVIGVDVSSKALENGAIVFYEKVLDVLSRDSRDDIESISLNNGTPMQNILPVEFRVGDGLRPLRPGEADAVAIAGMGVNSMIKILFHKSERGGAEIDRLECKKLFLQPTNSRPRNLIRLYDMLQNDGWVVQDERIGFVSSRWYITCAFSRTAENKGRSVVRPLLPGDKLMTLDADSLMYETHMDYVEHHRTWLERDLAMNGSLREDDSRWFDARDALRENT